MIGPHIPRPHSRPHPVTIIQRLLSALLSLRSRYGDHFSRRDLAEIESLIRDAESAEPAPPRRPGRPAGTAARPREFDVAEAARLRGEGLSYAAIGERLGVSRQAIHAALRRSDDLGGN